MRQRLSFGLLILASLILAGSAWAETVTAPGGSKFTIPPGFKKTAGMQTKSGRYTASWMNQKKKWSIAVTVEPKSTFKNPVELLEKDREKLAEDHKIKKVKVKGSQGAFLAQAKKGGKLLFRAASEEAFFEFDFILTRVDTKKYGPDFKKMADKVIRSLKLKRPAR